MDFEYDNKGKGPADEEMEHSNNVPSNNCECGEYTDIGAAARKYMEAIDFDALNAELNMPLKDGTTPILGDVLQDLSSVQYAYIKIAIEGVKDSEDLVNIMPSPNRKIVDGVCFQERNLRILSEYFYITYRKILHKFSLDFYHSITHMLIMGGKFPPDEIEKDGEKVKLGWPRSLKEVAIYQGNAKNNTVIPDLPAGLDAVKISTYGDIPNIAQILAPTMDTLKTFQICSQSQKTLIPVSQMVNLKTLHLEGPEIAIDIIPSSVTNLKRIWSIKSCPALPQGLEYLAIDTNDPTTLSQVSKLNSLNKLYLGDDCEGVINENIPQNVRKLVLLGMNNAVLTGLPENLRELYVLGRNWNGTLDNLPRNLQVLFLGDNFQGDLNGLPDTLHTLHIGENWNKPLDNTILPRNLVQLKIGNRFNQPITGPILQHENLRILQIGDQFNQELQTLPVNLDSLFLGRSFNKAVNLGAYPRIRHAAFGENFTQKDTDLSNIRCLQLPKSWEDKYPIVPRHLRCKDNFEDDELESVKPFAYFDNLSVHNIPIEN